MADTYEQLWRRILVYAPLCPIPLAQEFVNTAYDRMLVMGNFSALRAEGEFIIPPTYNTGTATVTQSSTTVTGAGTTWTTAMVGRQFFTNGRGAYYTITDVPSVTSLTLDRVWADASAAAQPYDVLITYITLPSDFIQFLSVLDRDNNWKLHTNYRQEQIDRWDAKRSVTGTPTMLVIAPYTSAGVPRAEIWPRATGGKTYSYRYMKQPGDLTNAVDTTIWPIASRVIRLGALVELSKWPGLGTAPNPYFNLELHKINEMSFREAVHEMVLEDQKIHQTTVTYDGEIENIPFAPIDAAYLQSHDVY